MSTPNIGSKILYQNQKLKYRKGEKFMYTWTAPQTMKRITKTGLFTFVNKQGKALRKKCNVSLLKPLFSEDAAENDEQRQLQKSNLNEKHS